MSDGVKASPVQGVVRFLVGSYTHEGNGGYPVYLSGMSNHSSFPIAIFVTEEEAKHYAEYRTTMLCRHGTTDVKEYEI